VNLWKEQAIRGNQNCCTLLVRQFYRPVKVKAIARLQTGSSFYWLFSPIFFLNDNVLLRRKMMASNKDVVRIYDNGGKTFDRFTAVFMKDEERGGLYGAVGMSEHPFHPQGYGMHCSAVPGQHLGRRIRFQELPEDCQKLIAQDIRVGYLKYDTQEDLRTTGARITGSCRIVDAKGVDMIQPWMKTKAEAVGVAFEQNIFLVEV